jgi:hypothetical protein
MEGRREDSRAGARDDARVNRDRDESPPVDGAETGVIDLLCAAVVSTARGVRGRSIFVGWTSEGLPAASTQLTGLTDKARESLRRYRGSGLPPRRVPYAALVPVTYVLTGSAVDFADTETRRAEDQVNYTVVDAAGRRRVIALGERGVLGGIAASRDPWQSTVDGSAGIGALAVDAVPLYTVFAPLPGARADTGLAMLFEPTLPGETNEPAFRSFVRNTISRLLMLDESQPVKSRKGYVEAAGKLASTPPRDSALQLLVWLRRAGLVEFSDPWLQGLRQSRRKVKGRFLKTMRSIGFVEVDDELLDELLNPRPDYDIDPLEIDQLLDLAEQMYQVARTRIG